MAHCPAITGCWDSPSKRRRARIRPIWSCRGRPDVTTSAPGRDHGTARPDRHRSREPPVGPQVVWPQVQQGMMVDVTADTDTEAAPLFREVGATWYWVLAGPISAAIMLWIEKSNGNGWQISVPVFFLVVLTSFIALQVKAARIHTSVVLTPQTLRQGTETIRVSEILKVYPEPDHPQAAKKDLGRCHSPRALGELVAVPKGRTGIGLRLTGGRTAQAWPRRHRHLRNLLTPLVEERVGPNELPPEHDDDSSRW